MQVTGECAGDYFSTVVLSGCYIDSAPDPHTERVREKGVRV